MNNVWILVADGAKASLLNYSTADKSLKMVNGGSLQHLNEPSRDMVSADRGRTFHGADDGARSAMERTSDPHQHEKMIFAGEIATLLERRSDQFDRLVVVAAPKTLGDLRQQLSATLKHKVILEIDKDLAGENQRELEAHLHKLIDFRQFHSQLN